MLSESSDLEKGRRMEGIAVFCFSLRLFNTFCEADAQNSDGSEYVNMQRLVTLFYYEYILSFKYLK